MNSPALRVAWYRFRATFRRRWSGYVALAALVGLVGGVALASVAAARRTDSSYPDFLAASIALAAAAALILANLVAAVPGQRAARTPAATVLRAE
jgi:predicted lysophospholipase L1 biosynthesis ABC-type transport system permease subunit